MDIFNSSEWSIWVHKLQLFLRPGGGVHVADDDLATSLTHTGILQDVETAANAVVTDANVDAKKFDVQFDEDKDLVAKEGITGITTDVSTIGTQAKADEVMVADQAGIVTL